MAWPSTQPLELCKLKLHMRPWALVSQAWIQVAICHLGLLPSTVTLDHFCLSGLVQTFMDAYRLSSVAAQNHAEALTLSSD